MEKIKNQKLPHVAYMEGGILLRHLLRHLLLHGTLCATKEVFKLFFIVFFCNLDTLNGPSGARPVNGLAFNGCGAARTHLVSNKNAIKS